MKTLKRRAGCILLTLCLGLTLSAHSRFTNYPLPSAPDTLRILAIGNSFSDDGTDYIPGLLEAINPRDGCHLTHQYSRYIAACTWFETLIQPVYGKTVLGNPYTLRDTEYSITIEDAILCQKCAVQAVQNRKDRQF